MGPTPSGSFPHPPPPPQGQHYEEEKRALSHEIVALNSHLLEAKVTIDKLSEDNVSVAPVTRGLPGFGGWPGEGGRTGPPHRRYAAEGIWEDCAGRKRLEHAHSGLLPRRPRWGSGPRGCPLPRAHETGPAMRHAPDG